MRLIILIVFILYLASGSKFEDALTDYTDPKYFTQVPWGSFSHWHQPWRAYIDTLPASSFITSFGVNFDVNSGENPDLMAEMLSRHGITNARIEIGWGSFDYYNESVLVGDVLKRVLACQKFSIRPMILLNANHGDPCPTTFFQQKVTKDVNKGDKTITLDDASKVVPGYSGLDYLTLGDNIGDNIANQAVDISKDGNTLTLSIPMPISIKAGTTIRMSTWKYRPFSPPDTEDYKATIVGWLRYVKNIATIIASTLGTTGKQDLGFDLEIWNELTFGDAFLNIDRYYNPPLYPNWNSDVIWDLITNATADLAKNNPSQFSGVRIGNGFSNTIPWPGAASQPISIHSINKHPYSGRKNFPADNSHGTPINALGEVDRSGFVPTYTELFPEYSGAVLQTETIVRDMSPITNNIQGGIHGRNSRIINGQIVSCPVWITEVNIGPNEDNPNISRDRALYVKSKIHLRYFAFYCHKGVEKLFIYDTTNGDTGLGLVLDSFIAYSKTSTQYPANDVQYTSPSLLALSNLVSGLKEGIDNSGKVSHKVDLAYISDNHNNMIFKGDNTPEHPNLYHRDVFVFLPLQVNQTRVVCLYYVMTRDIMTDLTPENYTIGITGVALSSQVSAYDPIGNKMVPVTVVSRTTNLAVTVTAGDYPYLLIIQEK